jgi:hypothetical protein
MKFISPQNSYFSAANGFSGFRSYFNQTFNPKKFTKLYILKGGPGTGKSSLMKKICTYFQNMGYSCEAIYCSSDPNSLDGVIINNNGKKIGILDGTAPHETDAKIPGAIDEVINLGSAWSEEKLISNRTKIVELNQKKGQHYKNAYEYLRLAGEFVNAISGIIQESYAFSDTQNINDIMYDITGINKGRNEEVKLKSCFGKQGYKSLDATDYSSKNRMSVIGLYGSEYIFMNHLLNETKRRGTDYIRYPSPYSDNLTEAIYLTENSTFISIGNDFDDITDTSEFLDENILKINNERLSYYSKQTDELLLRAEKEFSFASDAHFSLEAIYSPAMNFDIINILTDTLIKNISKLIC